MTRKSRISTAKSTTSFYSDAHKSMTKFYQAAKAANRVIEDDTMSQAESELVEKSLMQPK